MPHKIKTIFITAIALASFMSFGVIANQGESALLDGLKFLEENQNKSGVITTQSGLQYEIITRGDSDLRPKATDKVRVHYHGTLIDGTVFDSSVNRGQDISFGLNQVIAGWTEGVQLMAIGDKFRFFIPSELAYGSRGAGGIIGPNEALIFEVELFAINE